MNRFDYSLIPDHMRSAIHYYVKDGRHIGGFLTALFSNDLFKSVSKADDENLAIIPVYVCYIHNELPMGCHGSFEIVQEWQTKKRKEKESENGRE